MPTLTDPLVIRDPTIDAKYAPYSYIIFKDDAGKVYARNGMTGQIDFSGTDAATVIQSAINALAQPGTIFIRSGSYYITKPITLKWYCRIVGELASIRDKSTSFIVDSSFPQNDYVLKVIVSGNCPLAGGLENIFIFNPTGNPVYGLLLDASATGARLHDFVVRNLRTNYIDKGIHIKGYVWFCIFENILLAEVNSTYVGTQDIILEKATGDDYPKINRFINIRIEHAGTVTNAISIEGGYNKFVNLEIDGGKYDEATIKFGGATGTAASNLIIGYRGQDLVATANTVANIYFSGSSVFGNWVEGFISRANKSVCFANGAYRNYVRMNAFGLPPVIDATGAGADNVVEFVTPHLASTTTFTLTHTGNPVIYRGYRVQMSGVATIPAGQTSVTVSHGLAATPSKVLVTPRGNIGSVWVSARDSTSFTITCSTAPTADTMVDWYAEV